MPMGAVDGATRADRLARLNATNSVNSFIQHHSQGGGSDEGLRAGPHVPGKKVGGEAARLAHRAQVAEVLVLVPKSPGKRFADRHGRPSPEPPTCCSMQSTERALPL